MKTNFMIQHKIGFLGLGLPPKGKILVINKMSLFANLKNRFQGHRSHPYEVTFKDKN